MAQDHADDQEHERADQAGDGEAIRAGSHRRGVLLRIALRLRVPIGLLLAAARSQARAYIPVEEAYIHPDTVVDTD